MQCFLVVRPTIDVMAKRYFLYSRRVPTLQPIATNICTGHYVSQINNCANFGLWWRLHHSGLRYMGVKYSTFVRFLKYFFLSFPFLTYPSLSFFILAIAYSLNSWTDFDGWWLKMRGLVRGSTFCMFELCKTMFGAWYPLKTTPKSSRCWNPSQIKEIE